MNSAACDGASKKEPFFPEAAVAAEAAPSSVRAARIGRTKSVPTRKTHVDSLDRVTIASSPRLLPVRRRRQRKTAVHRSPDVDASTGAGRGRMMQAHQSGFRLRGENALEGKSWPMPSI